MIIKSQLKKKVYDNCLYLVSTPLGNLKDITLRAIETLKQSDLILCEDTRVSKKLFDKYEINSKIMSNHKFNEKKNVYKITELLRLGKKISLVSDAGTPAISDPGLVLVKECIKNDIKVIPIPGPSAVSTAISVSGFSDQFIFFGFLSEKKNTFTNELKKLSGFDKTVIFFLSSKKINKIIPVLKKYFLGRKVVFCREITKIYEEFIRIDVDKLELFKRELKGELTVVISEKINNKKKSEKLSESDINIINKMIHKFSTKEITDLICKNRNISKREIYNYCLKLKNEN